MVENSKKRVTMISVGYLGKSSTFASYITMKNKEEPVLTLDTVVDVLGLKDKMAVVKVDVGLVNTSGSAEKNKAMQEIWKKLMQRKNKWSTIRTKILSLEEVSDSLLPLVFNINYPEVKIEVVAGESTITISSKEIDLRYLGAELRKTEQKRLSIFGDPKQPKIKESN